MSIIFETQVKLTEMPIGLNFATMTLGEPDDDYAPVRTIITTLIYLCWYICPLMELNPCKSNLSDFPLANLV